MDNPTVELDDDDDDEGGSMPADQAERIRLRPYGYRAYEYKYSPDTAVIDFPRVNSQVPLSPKNGYGNNDPYSGYECDMVRDEEDDDNDDDDDSDDSSDDSSEDSEMARRHHPIKRLPSLRRTTSRTKRGSATSAASTSAATAIAGAGAGAENNINNTSANLSSASDFAKNKLPAKRKKKKKLKARATWQGKFDFILSLIGYSVGLGNVWRFPYLVYTNGGGAFLIPFIVMMCVVGFPLLFMELAFGQYASLSPVVIFRRFSPLFAGLGYGMICVSAVVMLYYNMIIAWTLYYMYASLSPELPWMRCDPAWSSEHCYSYKDKDDCLAADPNATYYNRTCYDAKTAAANNYSVLAHIAEKHAPADEYFNNYVLGKLDTIDQTGNIQLHLLVPLFVAWLMVFLCLSKGVQSSGKVVYFTALFPYVVLVILFVRGITLPGAFEGIRFYLEPNFEKLFVAQVWGDAAVQVFFALSPAWGGLITLASYNKFNNNCFRDSILVLLANASTSIFSGFVVFSIIGYLAHELEVEVTKVVDHGVGLAFMVYPEVVARLPISPLWSFLFFFMLITLGLDSQFALLETVQTAILDRFPSLRDHKFLVLVLVCIAGYAGGVIFTTQSGILWLSLFDKYAANFSVSIIAISECLLIAWYYGTERFIRDIEKMIGPRTERWKLMWTWMWKLVTPSTLIFILVFNWIKHEPARDGDYMYPQWADWFGWFVAFVPTMIIIGTMVHAYVTFRPTIKLSFLQTLNALMKPEESWGPTHRNIERLQRKSISSNCNSRKGSSIRGIRSGGVGGESSGGGGGGGGATFFAPQNGSNADKIIGSAQAITTTNVTIGADSIGVGQTTNHDTAINLAATFPNVNRPIVTGKTVTIKNGSRNRSLDNQRGGIIKQHKNNINNINNSARLTATGGGGSGKNATSSSVSGSNQSKSVNLHQQLDTHADNNHMDSPHENDNNNSNTYRNSNAGDCSSSSSELTTITPTNGSVKSGNQSTISCSYDATADPFPPLIQSALSSIVSGRSVSRQQSQNRISNVGDESNITNTTISAPTGASDNLHKSFDNPIFGEPPKPIATTTTTNATTIISTNKATSTVKKNLRF